MRPPTDGHPRADRAADDLDDDGRPLNRERSSNRRVGPTARLVPLVLRYPFVLTTVIAMLVGGTLALMGATVASFWVLAGSALLIAGVQAVGMVRRIRSGAWGLDVLAIIAIVSTTVLGDVWAAAVVALMLTGGQALEAFASTRARREVSALLATAPTSAHRSGPTGDTEDVEVTDVRIGDVLVVLPGEVVPVDGALLSATAEVDESSLTGESLPVTHVRGQSLLSGTVNGNLRAEMRATATAEQSQYQLIVELVEAAANSKAPFLRLADRYAIPFTIFALLLAGLAWLLSGEPARFAEVLVVATPCPLLIAAPVAFIAGMSRAARNGVIVKSGGTLEQLSRARTVAFDKTGTLTRGAPVVDRVEVFGTRSADEVLALAAAVERESTHVLARAVVTAARLRSRVGPTADHVVEVPGHGVSATVDGERIDVGKAPPETSQTTPRGAPLSAGEMAVFVTADGTLVGRIVLRDEVRAEAAQVVDGLRALGVQHLLMVTGDAGVTAEHVATAVGITDVHASLLPADKVAIIAAVSERPVVMVGDGVNDAPVLAAADVGVALGARGATAASEAADVVVLVDDLRRTVTAVAIAQRTVRVARQSIGIGIGLSIGLMLVATWGVLPAIIGATLQEVVDVVTILNSLRAHRSPRGLPDGERRR
ncbi:cadmium-translocating P-type ATPase [Plantibacter flavus]|uniref:heavy metal translocating P-type ATPase n=1 Tax=Plantibacter flavus TaxID=150123 RepID=UPI003F163AF7